MSTLLTFYATLLLVLVALPLISGHWRFTLFADLVTIMG
jgi:hypothetical protein